MIKLNHMALCTGSDGVVCDKVNLLFSENADGFDMVTSMCLKRAGLAGNNVFMARQVRGILGDHASLSQWNLWHTKPGERLQPMIPLAQKSSCIGAVCSLCKEITPTFSILRFSGLGMAILPLSARENGSGVLVAASGLCLERAERPLY